MLEKLRQLVDRNSPSRHWRVAAALALGVVVALTVSACGSSSSTSSSTVAGGEEGPSESIPNPTVTIGVYHEDLFESVDTNLWDSLTSVEIGRLTCVPLVWYPNESGKAGEELVPGLAEKMPTVSSDGLTYTFKIRPGLKFSNGKPLTAEDIKYTFYRIYKVDPGVFIPPIVGSQEVIEGKANEVSGVEADGNTLTIHLEERNGAFLQSISQAYTCPVPRGTPVKQDESGDMPATGPYMIDSYQPTQQLVLVRNPHFDPALGPKGVAGKFIFDLALDQTQALAKIKLGQLATTLESLPASDALLARNDPTLKGHVFSNVTSTLNYLWMNNDVAPFDNIDVRKAVNYALDRNQLVKVSGGSNAVESWDQMIPPPLAGKSEELYPSEPDLTKAKQLMKESGISLPVSTTIYTPSLTNLPLVAQVIQQDLEPIGIHANVHVASTTVTSAYVSVRSHHAPAGFGAWTQDYPDGGDFMQLVDPRLIDSDSNHSHFNVASMVPKFKSAAEKSGPEREVAYQELAKEVQEKYAPWAPLFMQVSTQATAPNVTGFAWQNAASMPLLTGIGLTE
jgi:peptide/nickel transport system substrate-binding protein